MAFSRQLQITISWMLALLGLMWAIELINFLSGHYLSQLGGIRPRELNGLVGIITSPLLHHGVEHLLMNSLPFMILGGLVFIQGNKRFIVISSIIIVVSGLAVWIFARPASHAGASGLIFGYLGYLLAAGWYGKNLQSVIIAILVAILYGGMIFGVFPTHSYISWEGHLSGFLSGVLAASLIHNKIAAVG